MTFQQFFDGVRAALKERGLSAEEINGHEERLAKIIVVNMLYRLLPTAPKGTSFTGVNSLENLFSILSEKVVDKATFERIFAEETVKVYGKYLGAVN